ncbi:MAG: 2-hydroxy-3-oxopropionate reductase [Planctomycetaceae bacterium]|nr:2-hydroxy-3-oxopropionate reductase [Planctomycetaceae bacterium]
MKRIGYLGLGIMGDPMARNLLKAGFEVTVWNRTAAKTKPLIDAGGAAADTPAAVAAQVQAVCINVTDTPDVEQVIFGPDGITAAGPDVLKKLIVIDNSTISPAVTRQFAEKLAESGAELLDAPVSGGDVGAQNGTLSIMVGGKPDVFNKCVPIFEAMGKAITHCGPSGAGQATKACNQVLCAVHMMGMCEAMALAKSEGLDLEKMLAVTTAGAGGSWALTNLGPRIAAGDLDPGFMIDLINKDLAIVRDEAKQSRLPMPGLNLAADLFNAAAIDGHGRDGTQAFCTVVEKLGGFKYTD